MPFFVSSTVCPCHKVLPQYAQQQQVNQPRFETPEIVSENNPFLF
jgi:hypothetical protein